MPRLFVSIDPPEPICDELVQLYDDVPGARWVDSEQLHLTIEFIGDVDGVVVEDVAHALRRVKTEPFELVIKGVGHFPPRREPKVLWAGADPLEPLQELKAAVQGALRRVGVKTESRKYAPHVTLARLRGTSSRVVGSFLAHHSLFRTARFEVDEFTLYSSQLTPKRAIHTPIETYLLGGRV